MQLAADTDTDRAIAELQRALPITALQNIIERREDRHRPRAELVRRLKLLRALQIADEVSA